MRNLMSLGLLLLLLLMTGSGCAYRDHTTFSNSRKLTDSRAPSITKVCFLPLVGLAESLWSPVTAYIDAREYARDHDHVYLSFVGTQTLVRSRMHPAYQVAGGILVGLIDLAWFPVAGTLDTVYVLSRPEPGDPEES